MARQAHTKKEGLVKMQEVREKEEEVTLQTVWIEEANTDWSGEDGPIQMYKRVPRREKPMGTMPYFLWDEFKGWTPRFIDLETFEPLAYRLHPGYLYDSPSARGQPDGLLAPGGGQVGITGLIEKITIYVAAFFQEGTGGAFGKSFTRTPGFRARLGLLARAVAENSDTMLPETTRRILRKTTRVSENLVNYPTWKQIFFQVKERAKILGRIAADMKERGTLLMTAGNASTFLHFFLGGAEAQRLLEPGELLIRATDQPGFKVSISCCYIDAEGKKQYRHPRIHESGEDPKGTGRFVKRNWIRTILLGLVAIYDLHTFVRSDKVKIPLERLLYTLREQRAGAPLEGDHDLARDPASIALEYEQEAAPRSSGWTAAKFV